MALSHEDLSRLLALVPQLGPGGDRSAFVSAVHEIGPQVLDELGALPGVDQLRAALLRALPDLAPEAEESLLRAADEALAVYPEMAASDDPVLTLTRHPAWVGLAVLELAERRGIDGLDQALTLALAGFTGSGGDARGELLWALAEAADEAQWTARSAELLETALDAPFADEDGRGEVRLLLALRRAEDGDPRAPDLLASIADSGGPTRRRVHAAWVLAALVREREPARAIRVLAEAMALLDADPAGDPSVRDRLAQALVDLGAPSAEA